MAVERLTNDDLVDIFFHKKYDFLLFYVNKPNIELNFLPDFEFVEKIDFEGNDRKKLEFEEYTWNILINSLIDHYFKFPNKLLKDIILRIANHSCFDINYKNDSDCDILLYCTIQLNDNRRTNVEKAFIFQIKTVVLEKMNRDFTTQKEYFFYTLNRSEKRKITEDLDVVFPQRKRRRLE